jgi:hypothetical protein
MVGFTTSVATVTAAVASVPTVKAKAPEPKAPQVVGVVAETPATSTVSSRQLLLGSLDSSTSLIQKVRTNAASTDTLDRAAANELAKTLRDLANQLDAVYNN